MAKLRHVAIMCDDPAAAAEFYTKAFGLQELDRLGDLNVKGGIYLTDGTINIALIKVTDPNYPNAKPMGLNHIGFVVEDTAEAVATAKQLGAVDLVGEHVDGDVQEDATYEVKMRTPDGVAFDLSAHGWPGIGALT